MCKSLTTAHFQEDGKEPDCIDELIMEQSGEAMAKLAVFRRLAGIPSRPVLLWGLIADSLEWHSSVSIVSKLRLTASGELGVGLIEHSSVDKGVEGTEDAAVTK